MSLYTETTPRFFDLGHSEVAVRTFGRGPDVVFVHGWPVSSATFRDLAPALADSFTCHLIDLPGGPSETKVRDERAIDLGRHPETVRAVIDRLELPRYAMLAHDSGALITRYVAARDPERVAGLVMGNTEIPGYHPWQMTLYLAAARLPGGAALFRLLLRNRRFRNSAAALGACFEDLERLDGEFGEL
ncbi:MAG: alpha/beta fold hydrolase, partial [Myxococcota bacterium]